MNCFFSTVSPWPAATEEKAEHTSKSSLQRKERRCSSMTSQLIPAGGGRDAAQDFQALADAGGGMFLLVCIAASASLSLAAGTQHG